MRFKIVTVGWNCGEFIERTLRSIEAQTVTNYDVMIIDDATSDPRQAELIEGWCAFRSWSMAETWSCRINTERLGPVRNQYEAIMALDPADDDVIVWLDLDGDTFAHPSVLDNLKTAYADGETMLTYGSYRPVPDMGTSSMASPFPPKVVRNNSYRWQSLNVGCYFNHLRTMRGDLFRSIPEDQFHWPDGRWYEAATDYIFMVAGLERAGGRYKFLDEVLMYYNHANPHSTDPGYHLQTNRCNVNFLNRPALEPLAPIVPWSHAPARAPASHRPEGWTDEWLPAEGRRALLREMGEIFGLKTFIETGTHVGATPMALKDDFETLHTIELGTRYYQQAVAMFRPYPQVVCWHGDSAEILPKVLDEVRGPALIWLDGHHSGGDTARGSADSPVRAELAAVFATDEPHVILVDDARCFAEGSEHDREEHYADYPSITWVRELAEANDYHFVLEDDIMRLTPW